MVGVPTLEALAYHCIWEGVRLVPMMDAQKGNVYTEEFAWTWESGKPVLHSVCPLRILPRDALVASLAGTEKTVLLMGDAMQKTADEPLPAGVRLAPIHMRMPCAACVGLAGLARLARDAADDAMTLEPLYLRRSEAEVLWEKRHGAEQAV